MKSPSELNQDMAMGFLPEQWRKCLSGEHEAEMFPFSDDLKQYSVVLVNDLSSGFALLCRHCRVLYLQS